MFQAYLPESIWYNTDLVKLNELRSFDDFLNPKWKGKIFSRKRASLPAPDAATG